MSFLVNKQEQKVFNNQAAQLGGVVGKGSVIKKGVCEGEFLTIQQTGKRGGLQNLRSPSSPKADKLESKKNPKVWTDRPTDRHKDLAIISAHSK